MSDFFMWGGFVFCAIWHFYSWSMLLPPSFEGYGTKTDMTDSIGFSGMGLCYFGMQAFG
jgi:hypothetical protein